MRRLVIGLTLIAAPAFAGSHDFVIEHEGAGGNSQTAQPYIDQFLRYAEQALKWPAGSAKGQFAATKADALQLIAQLNPGFGIVDPWVFLDLHDKHDLVPIAAVEGENQFKGHLSVVVQAGKYKSLAELKGKTLVSNYLQDPKFLSKVVFDGKLDAATYFQLQPTASPLKGIKGVANGQVDATLVDDKQLASMKSLPVAGQLKVIHTSPALPTTPAVAFAKNTTPAEREAFAKMLLGMCKDPKGAEVCKALQIERFTPADKAAYEAAVRKYK